MPNPQPTTRQPNLPYQRLLKAGAQLTGREQRKAARPDVTALAIKKRLAR